jgi:hypothetical protein
MLVGCASYLPNDGVRDLVGALIAAIGRAKPALTPLPAAIPTAIYRPGRLEVREPALTVEAGHR